MYRNQDNLAPVVFVTVIIQTSRASGRMPLRNVRSASIRKSKGGATVKMSSYPSVTQILSLYQDFSNVPEATLEHATLRGTEVHKSCAAYALGLFAPKLPPEWQGFVVSTRRWFDQMVEKVILVETQLVDEAFGFTGTPDYLLKLKNIPHLTICDLKTPIGRYKIWAGQLAAYLRLAQVNDYDARDALTLQPNPNGGSAKAHYLEYGAEALAAFLGALQGWRYFCGNQQR